MESRSQVAAVPASNNGDGVDPIRDIVANGDYTAFAERLAEDVVFNSPAARFSVHGREQTAFLFETMVKESDRSKWRVTDFWDMGDTHLMALTMSIGGFEVQLLNVTRIDENGQIRNLTAYARPMASIAVFPAFIFPHLVRKTRGPRRAAIVGAICRPLPRILELGVLAGLRLGQPPGTDLKLR